MVAAAAQALRQEQGKVMEDLKEQIAAAKATQGNTEDMLARADKAEKLAKQLQEQLQSSEKTSSSRLAQLAGRLKDIEEKSQVLPAWCSASCSQQCRELGCVHMLLSALGLAR